MLARNGKKNQMSFLRQKKHDATLVFCSQRRQTSPYIGTAAAAAAVDRKGSATILIYSSFPRLGYTYERVPEQYYYYRWDRAG